MFLIVNIPFVLSPVIFLTTSCTKNKNIIKNMNGTSQTLLSPMYVLNESKTYWLKFQNTLPIEFNKSHIIDNKNLFVIKYYCFKYFSLNFSNPPIL